MRYGVPYKGSKNRIADWVVDNLPKGGTLVDLFAGGCAVTHCAIRRGGWSKYIVNDIDWRPIKLFHDALLGKCDALRWISREDFSRLKDSDPSVALCWSFGNNSKDYLYAEEIEPLKKAYHYAAVFGDFSHFEKMGISILTRTSSDIFERRRQIGAFLKQNMTEIKAKYIEYWLGLVDEKKREYERIYGYVLRSEDLVEKVRIEEERLRGLLLDALRQSGLRLCDVDKRLGNFMSGHYFGRSQWAFPTPAEYEKLREFLPLPADYYEVTNYYTIIKRLQSLQSLQSLQHCERLAQLHGECRGARVQFFTGSYQEVELPDDAVIYCDIPYYQTTGYAAGAFDYETFYEWCRNQMQPVVISEYSMPDDFVCIAEHAHVSAYSASKSLNTTERLFVPRHQAARYGKAVQQTLFD